jgi:hypothetical protein
MEGGSALAQLSRAGIANLRGQTARAVEHLRAAVRGFEAVDMALHATVAQRYMGKLVGGDRGASLVATADAWMAEQGVKDASKMSAMVAPGLPC